MRPGREGRLHPPHPTAFPWLLTTGATYNFSIGKVHIGAVAL